MKLTKKFIKENAGMTLKEAFPEAFETVLEVGKWYKYINTETLVFVEDVKKQKGYGFYDGNYEYSHNNWAFHLTDIWIPATPQEIQDALEKEAVRRGYMDSAIVKPLWETPLYSWNIQENQVRFEEKSNAFYFGCCIFKDGIWAQIIPTITKQEAEERLGMKII